MWILPFKAKYKQDCLAPYKFEDLNLPVLAAKNTLEETDRQMQVIRQSLKSANIDRRVKQICIDPHVSPNRR